MSVPIMQFWSSKRAHVDYDEMDAVHDWCIDAGYDDPVYLNAIKHARRAYRDDPGLIVLEQDVAIDPAAIAAMRDSISNKPYWVWTSPYILWPASTGQKEPQWAHANSDAEGRRIAISARADPGLVATWFGLGFTYLPAELIDAAPDTEQSWEWKVLSGRLSELAGRMRIRIAVVGWPVTHLHW